MADGTAAIIKRAKPVRYWPCAFFLTFCGYGFVYGKIKTEIKKIANNRIANLMIANKKIAVKRIAINLFPVSRSLWLPFCAWYSANRKIAIKLLAND